MSGTEKPAQASLWNGPGPPTEKKKKQPNPHLQKKIK